MKLTENAWRKIAQLHAGDDVPIAALAIRFGVSHEAIRQGLKKRGAIQVCSQLKRKNVSVGRAAQSAN